MKITLFLLTAGILVLSITTGIRDFGIRSSLRNINTEVLRQTQLEMAVNNATQEMLSSSLNIQADSHTSDIYIDPYVAEEAFRRSMSINSGVIVYDKMITSLYGNYLDSFVVVDYDGLYILSMDITAERNSNGDYSNEYDFYFSEKIPFTYTKEISPTSNVYYSLNLDRGLATQFNGSAVVPNVDSGLSRSEQGKIILDTIVNALQQNINANRKGEVSNNIYLPLESAGRVSGINSIETPIVLAYASDEYLPTVETGSNLIVGGSRLVGTRKVGCYETNGKMLYMYLDELDNVDVKILEVFNTPEQAANAGYFYDVKRRFNK